MRASLLEEEEELPILKLKILTFQDDLDVAFISERKKFLFALEISNSISLASKKEVMYSGKR